MKTALDAFEEYIRNDPVKGIEPDIFLKKLEGTDNSNPEYFHLCVDSEWRIWRESWKACLESIEIGIEASTK